LGNQAGFSGWRFVLIFFLEEEVKVPAGERIGKSLIYFFIAAFAALCFLPFVLAIIVSFSAESSILRNGYSLFPDNWSLEAYRIIFTNKTNPVFNAYMVTIIVTVVGTLLNVTITSMAAFTLANKNVDCRGGLSMFFFVTMVFSGGIVPWYLMCRSLGLTNNIFALIIPSLLFSPFNLFLVRNYMQSIPDSLRESALIDGARDPTILFKIFVPLCTPVLATIVLFTGLGYWNDWFNAIMLVDNSGLYPLQYLLFRLQSDVRALQTLQGLGVGYSAITLPSEALKMATAVVTIGPIIILYPFLQKYFVKGLIIGAIKG
jgi:putative aldouronate transport system permease protein